jgi:hypothetical protein
MIGIILQDYAKSRWGGAPSAPAIHPAIEIAGFLAELL